MLLVVLFKINFPWNFLVFFVIFFPASIAYSIVKHNLFDADAIIKRTVGYIVVTGIVIAAYLIVSLALNVTVGQYQISQSQAFPIVPKLTMLPRPRLPTAARAGPWTSGPAESCR